MSDFIKMFEEILKIHKKINVISMKLAKFWHNSTKFPEVMKFYVKFIKMLKDL